MNCRIPENKMTKTLHNRICEIVEEYPEDN